MVDVYNVTKDRMAAGDVALGRQVHDGVDLVRADDVIDQLTVADVALHEDVVRVVLELLEVLEVPRVGQLVVVDDLPRRAVLPQPLHEVAADEAAPAGHHDVHGGWL